MSKADRKLEIERLAGMAGFHVATYSPGDGLTRYRFFDEPSSYFGPASARYTALGIREAETFALGLAYGATTARKVDDAG